MRVCVCVLVWQVHAYMRFVRRACATFFLCFLLALPQLLSYLEGGDMAEMLNPFNALSLGNGQPEPEPDPNPDPNPLAATVSLTPSLYPNPNLLARQRPASP
jgi:hypothetical protein